MKLSWLSQQILALYEFGFAYYFRRLLRRPAWTRLELSTPTELVLERRRAMIALMNAQLDKNDPAALEAAVNQLKSLDFIPQDRIRELEHEVMIAKQDWHSAQFGA